MLVHGQDDLLRGDAELLGGGVDDALVRLMGTNQSMSSAVVRVVLKASWMTSVTMLTAWR